MIYAPASRKPLKRGGKPNPHKEKIRKEAEAGVSYAYLARKYKTPEGSIRAWSSEGQWAVPRRIAKIAKRQRKTKLAKHCKGQDPSSAELAAESIGEMGEGIAVTLLHKLKKKAAAAVLPDVTCWQDVALLAKTSQALSGRDKPLSAIQINLSSTQPRSILSLTSPVDAS